MTRKGMLTRQKIITESLQLFSVKGYNNTSLNDILEVSGLTKGGLYGRFASKEAIWKAAYQEAVAIWKSIVFKDIQGISDPIVRIQKAIDNDLRQYLGGNVFQGGCIFLNTLVELSGQCDTLSNELLHGILGFSGLIGAWLHEAQEKSLLKPGVNIKETADFIVISLNGCAALYASSKNPALIDITLSQINRLLEHLRVTSV